MILSFCGSLFLATPLLAAILSFFLFYNVTGTDLTVPLILLLLSFFIIGFELFKYFKCDQGTSRKIEINQLGCLPGDKSSLKKILNVFIVVVVLFGLLDLLVHGVVILDPSNYATFNPLEARIRHISSLVWIFAPLSLFKYYSRGLRLVLFAWSILFPVLTLDRNRLMMALILFGITYSLVRLTNAHLQKRLLGTFFLIAVAAGLFGSLGSVRSGSDSIVNTYTAVNTLDEQLKNVNINVSDLKCQIPAVVPIKESLQAFPFALQWLIVYTSSPIYNLSIQHECNLRDSSLLWAQIVPLWKRFNSVGSPLLITPYLTASTEAMPFYLAFGITGLFVCLLMEFFLLKQAAAFFFRQQSFFSLIILLRFIYCAIFFAFAPQFYLWSTLGICSIALACDGIMRALEGKSYAKVS